MCGIVGGTSERNVLPILVEGLRRLEYRGYDSAGVAFKKNGSISVVRNLGRVESLAKKINLKNNSTNLGIAHTRWATHGVPSEKNAHPHNSKDIYVVHNGIIENHQDLRAKLEAKGIKFHSQTDTEVIAHLIQNHLEKGKSFEQAVISASNELKGAYALGIINKKDPEQLIGVRNQSPLVVGKGFQENFIASDVMALAPVTNQFIYLEDGQLAFLNKEKATVKNLKNKSVRAKTYEVDSNSYTTDLAGHSHFMEKEIFEQPRAVKDAIEGRLTNKESQEGIFGAGFEKEIKDITNIQIVACGTSYHSARIFEFWSHKFLGINCRVDYGSEYQYQEPIKTDKTLLITISQSGETADTLSSLKFAKKTGKPLSLAICNVANSSICRESDYTLLTNAGPEISVASTKAFVTQLACVQAGSQDDDGLLHVAGQLDHALLTVTELELMLEHGEVDLPHEDAETLERELGVLAQPRIQPGDGLIVPAIDQSTECPEAKLDEGTFDLPGVNRIGRVEVLHFGERRHELHAVVLDQTLQLRHPQHLVLPLVDGGSEEVVDVVADDVTMQEGATTMGLEGLDGGVRERFGTEDLGHDAFQLSAIAFVQYG